MAVANSASSAGAAGDVRTTGLVGLAHFTSHFLMFATAPLLPLMKDAFGVSFTQLGLMLTVFFATSGVGQVVAGIFVDRFGPHRLLLAGMALQAAAVAAMGLAPSFLLLFPLQFVAGVGNCVYHPSNLSILGRRVTRGRQGRAFASHSMAGSLGFAVSPLVVGFAGAAWGWRPALVVSGLLGLVIAVAMLANRAWLRADDVHPDAASESERSGGPAAQLGFAEILALPVVIFGVAFFFFTTLGFHGLMTFAVSALTEGYGMVLATATVAVAVLQFGSMGGTLVGGVIADRFGRHQRVAAVAVLASAAFMLPIVYTGLPLALIIGFLLLTGFFYGVALPSRDLLIRQSAPPGGLGKTVGTVYSGLDGGALLAPLLIGPLLDHGASELLFLFGAVALVVAVFTLAGLRGAGDTRAA